jgi:hypothetical protein
MKLFITFLSLALTFTASAFAKNSPEETQGLVRALIQNSAIITVVDKDLDTKEKNLSALLAEALSASLYSNAKNQVVVTMESSCKSSTPVGIVGVSTKDCQLIIGNADYKKTAKGLTGPAAESATVFLFQTTTPVVPHPQPKIKGNVVYVQRAG